MLAALLAAIILSILCGFAVHRGFHYGSQELSAHEIYRDIWNLALFSMFFTGSNELASGGHMKTKRFLTRCATGAFAAALTFIAAEVIFKFESPLPADVVFGPVYVFMAAPWAAALYLNRKQPESTPQSTSDNVS